MVLLYVFPTRNIVNFLINFTFLIVSLVMSRLDCGNAMLAGSPSYMFDKLQSIMKAAARLIHGGSKASCHFFVTCTGCKCHSMLSTNCQFSSTAVCITWRQNISDELTCRHAADFGSRRLRSSSSSALVIPSTRLSTVVSMHFLLQLYSLEQSAAICHLGTVSTDF